MGEFKKKTIKFLMIYFGSIFLFVILMTLAYSIPNSLVEDNVKVSMKVIKSEGVYPKLFFNSYACALDNFTDNLMLDKSIIQSDSKNALWAAMDINNYARYWHGYQVLLRPLLVLISYQHIRYINMFVMFILLCLVFSLIHQKLGVKISIAYIIALVSTYVFIVPMSMQFMSVFVIMLLTSYIILLNDRNGKNIRISELFFITGMVTNFFDLLTAPLITLGMPLLVLLNLRLKQNEGAYLKKNLVNTLSYSFLWTLGYSLCWLGKLIIGSIILNKNVIIDAFKQAVFRTTGNQIYHLDRLSMLMSNIHRLFPMSGVGLVVFALILLTFVFVVILLYKKSLSSVRNVIPFLIVGIYPYIWFNILASHSAIHSFFTYRIQMITLFAVLISIIYIIDWEKINNDYKKVRFKICKSVKLK